MRKRFWLWHLAVPVVSGVLVGWLVAITAIDEHVSQWFYDPVTARFPLQDTWFMEQVMHGYTKWPIRLIVVSLLLLWVASYARVALRPWRRVFMYTLFAMMLGAGLVSWLKHVSNVFCPADLQMFGGQYPFQWPFQVPVVEGVKAGQCWPGGHASYGFVLFSLYFALRDHHRPLAYAGLAAALLYGNILGFARVIQGQHFLSHQCWTALLCWLSALLLYVLLLRRDLLPGSQPQAKAQPQPQTKA